MGPSAEHEDHILVRTVQGEVKSCRMSEIVKVTEVRVGHTCRVQHRTTLVGVGNTLRSMDIQESREVFLERCEKLQLALRDQNEAAITRHFAPRFPAKDS